MSIGENNATRKEFIASLPIVETAHYRSVWGGSGWTRNGVPSSGPNDPLDKVVPDAETLTFSTEGDRTLRLQWINPTDPPPDQVRIWIRTQGQFACSPTIGGGSVEDGLGTEVEDFWQFFGQGKRAQGFAIQTLTVENGVAELTLHQSATAEKSLGTGATGAVHAAITLHWGIDARIALVLLNGGEVYRPSYSTGTQTSRNITYTRMMEWWSYTSHTQVNNYVEPYRVPATITYSTNANSSSWTVGIPELSQTVTDNTAQMGGIIIVPNPVPPHNFQFTGYATSQRSAMEWFQWGSAAAQYSSLTDWIIAPQSTTKASPFVTQFTIIPNNLSEPSVKYGTSTPQPLSNETIVLKYHWEDGTEVTSTRSVIFSDPIVFKSSFDEVIDDRCTQAPDVLVGEWRNVDVLHDEPVHVVFVPARWGKSALVAIAAFAEAGFEIGAGFAPEAPQAWGIAAGVASLCEILLEFTPDGEQSADVRWSQYLAYWSEWHMPGDPNSPYHGKPSWANPSEWEWMVEARPKKKVQVKLYEKFDTQGFRGLYPRIDENYQSKGGAPRLYKFRYQGIGGGSGGTGGGSPG